MGAFIGRGAVEFAPDKVSIVVDGNSLIHGLATVTPPNTYSATVPGRLAVNARLNGVAVQSIGVNGQTTAQMTSRVSAYVTPKWVEGKTNILVVWEATNSIFGPSARTGAQAFADMQAYCSSVLSAHPWRIVILTTLPRMKTILSQGQVDTLNAELVAFDALVRANFKAIGAAAVCDVRAPGSPFILGDYTDSAVTGFNNPVALSFWNDNGNDGPQHVHLNNAGYSLIADWIASTLRRVTKR